MKTVKILGTAPNLADTYYDTPVKGDGIEVWAANERRGILKRCSSVIYQDEWTRWFNLHSRAHMDVAYPPTVAWYKLVDRPVYLQLKNPDIPASVEFPRKQIQNFFAINGEPNRYFTCSVCWLIAFAIMEGFEKIELHGFMLSDRKPNDAYLFERPCFFYWVQEARNRGIEVWYPEAVEQLPFIPGDPSEYTGPLYGYDTKPDPSWNPLTQEFE